jgi:hypothetical protein
MVEIEYTIHPDGRIEQKVQGVKGKACLEITAEIEQQLGEVVEVKPTEEMFEQEVNVQEDVREQAKQQW